jgi:hypothetical protein
MTYANATGLTGNFGRYDRVPLPLRRRMLTYTLNKIMNIIEIALLLSVALIALLYCPMRPATRNQSCFSVYKRD